MKRKKIKIPVYGGNLYLIQTEDFKSIEDKYRLQDTSLFDAFTFPLNGDYFMCFGKKWDYNIIAHESLHVVSDLFNDCNITMDLNNQEPQCYLLGWVVEQCHKFLEGAK